MRKLTFGKIAISIFAAVAFIAFSAAPVLIAIFVDVNFLIVNSPFC